MPYFRKRSAPIEAREFTYESAKDLVSWSGGAVKKYGSSDMYLSVYTREGEKTATLGDWIVKGEDGDFFPVSRKKFIQTYRPA